MAPRNKPKTGEDKAKDDSKTSAEEKDPAEKEGPQGSSQDAEDDSEDEEELEEESTVQPDSEPSDEMHEPPVGQASAIAPQAEPHAEDENAKSQELSDHVLDSPQAFGIWINGSLHRFKKGKTRLTHEQKKACLTDKYVRANRAQVLKLVSSKAPAPKKAAGSKKQK